MAGLARRYALHGFGGSTRRAALHSHAASLAVDLTQQKANLTTQNGRPDPFPQAQYD